MVSLEHNVRLQFVLPVVPMEDRASRPVLVRVLQDIKVLIVALHLVLPLVAAEMAAPVRRQMCAVVLVVGLDLFV